MTTKIKLYLLMLLASLALLQCSDDDDDYSCKSCVDSPEAVAANDNSGKGIYKGVVVGSSGTIKLNIANTGTTISGELIIDGQTITLAPYQNDGVYDGGYEGYLSGTMSVANDVLVWVYFNSTGTSYYADFEVLPGHPDADIEIMKEYSTQLIEAFEGTFSGDESGTFNLVLYRDANGNGEWYALSKDSENEMSYHYGDIDDDDLSSVTQDVIIVGEVDDDEVDGTWEVTGGGSGRWKGKRTL